MTTNSLNRKLLTISSNYRRIAIQKSLNRLIFLGMLYSGLTYGAHNQNYETKLLTAPLSIPTKRFVTRLIDYTNPALALGVTGLTTFAANRYSNMTFFQNIKFAGTLFSLSWYGLSKSNITRSLKNAMVNKAIQRGRKDQNAQFLESRGINKDLRSIIQSHMTSSPAIPTKFENTEDRQIAPPGLHLEFPDGSMQPIEFVSIIQPGRDYHHGKIKYMLLSHEEHEEIERHIERDKMPQDFLACDLYNPFYAEDPRKFEPTGLDILRHEKAMQLRYINPDDLFSV
jgi:hypothetical protein